MKDLNNSQLSELFFKASHTCLGLLDENFNYIRVNDTFAKASGHAMDFFPGKNHFDICPSNVQRSFENVRISKTPVRMQSQENAFFTSYDQEISCWDWSLEPILDDMGNISFFVFSVDKVTKGINARQTLQENKSSSETFPSAPLETLFFQDQGMILDEMVDTFYRTDIDGRVIIASKSVEKLLGYKPDEVIGLELATLYMDPNGRENFLHALEKNHGQLERYEAELRHRDGYGVWVSTSSGYARDVEGKVIGVEGTVRNITDEKQSREKLKRYRANLETVVAERTAQVDIQAQIIEQIHDAVVSADLEGFVTSWNPGAERIYGYTAKEAIGQHILFVHPENQHAHVQKDVLAPLLKTGISVVDVCMRRKNGEEFHGHLSLSLLKDHQGKPQGMIGFVMDINRQKIAEHRLQESESKYRELFETSHDAIMILDRNGFLDANQAALDIFACSSHEEFIGKHPGEISPPFQEDGTDSRIASAYRDKKKFFEWTHRKLNGEDFPAEVLLTPMKYAGREVLQVIIRDISERKQAEKKLEAGRQYFESLDEISKILSGRADLDKLLSETMKTLLNLFRVERAWLLYPCDPDASSWGVPVEVTHPDFPGAYISGKPIPMDKSAADVFRLALSRKEPITQDFSREKIPVAAKTYEIQSQIIMALHPRGEKPWLLGLHQCRQNRGWSEDEIRMFHDIGQRITDTLTNRLLLQRLGNELEWRKKTEQELIIAKEQAEEANLAKSEFLSSMSHELRTPMNAILGFGQLLTMESLLPEHKDLAEEILNAGNHLLALINEILDLEKIEAGRVQVSLEPVALSNILQECEALILPQARSRQIKIDMNYIFSGAYSVMADRVRLKQVLLNILTNAVKYNREFGSIKVICRPKGNRLQISISDSGIGIAKERQHGLFTAFERLGAETTDIEGTGIGLVITKSLLELMDGDISFQSEAGKGSTFHITLPMGNQGHILPHMDSTIFPYGRVESNDGESTILYIEDNSANMKLVMHLIARRPGTRLLTADEPHVGLNIMKHTSPDLILLDINMPDMDGYQVLEHLKRDQQYREIPVIAVSASAMSSDIERGISAGFDAYITKPINVQEFYATLDRILH